MDYLALKNELDTDPLERGYAGMTTAEVVTSLNEANIPVIVPISSKSLVRWAGVGGRWARLKKLADKQAPYTEASDALWSIGLAAETLVNREDTTLDLNNADSVAMVDALQAAGIVSAEDRAAQEALATEQHSRAQVLCLGIVYEGHVIKARALGGQ